MKTLLAVLTIGLFSFGAIAQSSGNMKATQTSKMTPHAVATGTYKCPVCGATASKAGDCSKDKVAMVKVGDYYCPDCYMSSSKPGKCSMCGVDMKQMTSGTK